MDETLQSLTLLNSCSNTHNHPKQESEDEQEELSGNFKKEQLCLYSNSTLHCIAVSQGC